MIFPLSREVHVAVQAECRINSDSFDGDQLRCDGLRDLWRKLVRCLAGDRLLHGRWGMMVMFYRWRRQGDRDAAVLVVAAFATWALAVAVGSVTGVEPGTPAFWIAGVALIIGVGGGLATLVRMYREHGEASSSEQG